MKELVNLINASPRLEGAWIDEKGKYYIHEFHANQVVGATYLTREEILELGEETKVEVLETASTTEKKEPETAATTKNATGKKSK